MDSLMTEPYPTLPIMLVDDEEQFLAAARLALGAEGITNVERVIDGTLVMNKLSEKRYGVVALDITMPVIGGLELLERIGERYPEISIIMISGLNEVEAAVDCMRKGADDYLVKPVSSEVLTTRMRRILEHRAVVNEAATLKRYVLSRRLRHPEAFREIITVSPVMKGLFEYAEAIARTTFPVLVTGETGTGKELMARAFHRLSNPEGPFVAMNIAGQSDNMMSDVLFGHVKGAFTGADRARNGLIEEAAGGTLFLDEIGDLSAESQLKLLRLLQEKEYFPVGSDKARKSKARIVAATNQNIAINGGFRRDLYYRLHTHELHLPPLRERRADIPLLTKAFIERACLELDRRIVSVPPELDILFANHDFPGNVRELRSLVYDAVGTTRSRTLSLKKIKEK
ncbi:MAG: response regulator, partial [Chitinivibrionales bacterium]|nr:response regulator [Chitinivibrionales bacterium]MBD3355999.1 response regulator [Chitinivibrionales bacterium]